MIRTAQQILADIHEDDDGEEPGTLTAEQRVLLGMVADGHTHAAIARLCGIHPTSVQKHLSRVYRRLAARNAPHAVAIAIRAGLLPAPEQGSSR